jgi:predicted metal-dependent phosphoesterase TrpH
MGDGADQVAVPDTSAKTAAPVLGRLHIAQAMVRKRYVKTITEAFDRYLAIGRPAYVDKERFTPPEVLAAITQARGVPVLAHPPQLNYGNAARIEQIIKDLKPHGLLAIEAYHSDNSPQQTRLYLDLARKHNLFVSGGSDFHGPAKSGVVLGRPPVPLVACEELIQRLQGRS